MKFIRSNLVGFVALIVALGGTAYAVQKAPKNSVVSRSIKNGQVKAGDLAKGAVGRPKLKQNSVDSSKVANDSLTGADIDESSLALPAAAPQSGSTHEGRIVISPGDLVPNIEGNPEAFLQFNSPVIGFDPTIDKRAGAIAEVPLDRAPDTGLEVRILWEANGTGDASWGAGFALVTPGTAVSVAEGSDVPATSTASNTVIETTLAEIPGGAVQNGDRFSLLISRNADAPSDTLPVFANLRLVEIRYTAAG